MKSKNVDKFNHDPWHQEYDKDVLNESDPIRAGYSKLLPWVVQKANITPQSSVLDLGSGTGNTSCLIKSAKKLTCVDISKKMSAIATSKLSHLPEVSFCYTDLLEFFDTFKEKFDTIVSTYAIHHLTDDEKAHLFKHVYNSLNPGGRASFGDLMFENEAQKTLLAEKYKDPQKYPDVAESIKEEFFWLVDKSKEMLEQSGFKILDIKQFSDLSWGICVQANK